MLKPLLSANHTKKKLNALSLYSLCLTIVFAVNHSPSSLASEKKLNESHAIAMHGDIKYEENFEHFDYTDPKAIKGGKIRLASQGTFDSLNPFIAKGTAADHLGLLYDTLTTASQDEPFTQYGLIAEKIIWPNSRDFVEYKLNPKARFSDGKAITAKDVKFTFELLMQKASPLYKTLYQDVSAVKIIDKHHIRFEFKNTKNQELVLIVGQLPVLPSHSTNPEAFAETSLNVPVSSGPYFVEKLEPGKRINFKLNERYWAKDLNVNKGRYNFAEIQVDYYRDSTVMLEALKAGEYDFRYENVSKLWATAYNGTALASGKLKKQLIPHQNPTGMQAFLMNQRNPLFKDIRVRKALNYVFDFEWTNKQLFYGAYKRTNSFFSNSELAAIGLPSEAELALLKPLEDALPASVFTEAFSLPKTQGDGRNRQQLRQAKLLLESAGWTVKNNQLINARGDVFKFEFLTYDPAFERIINPFIKGLKRLGIQASIHKVEVSQYINKLREFDYDIVTYSYGQSLSPGIEQKQFWHSSTADMKAGRNFLGLRNSAIDELVDHVIQAHTREELVTATKALDRALLHNWYVIPQWYIDSHRIAYWDKFAMPKSSPPYDGRFSGTLHTWWIDSNKAKTLR